MTRFQRLALTAFICVEVLIFVGAIVRVTGSGLGCPDWPFCYGRWVPPTAVEQIDFTKLNLDKFKAKAARLGRDPSSITEASIKAEFDPVATWIEYINRLTSLPVGFSVLALLLGSFGEWRRGRGIVCIASVAAVILVGLNAWLGARVVLSGLQPGTITLHMGLAVLLLCVLVFVAWRGCEQPWRLSFQSGPGFAPLGLRYIAVVLFSLVIVEGLMGSQVRELTDELAKAHAGQGRALWVAELEQSWVYLVHRSFSWLVLGAGIGFIVLCRRALLRGNRWLEKAILGLILAQMLLGIVLARVGIVRTAQVLHIGLSSLLVSALCLWLLGAWAASREAGLCSSEGR
jgi:heme a synthase